MLVGGTEMHILTLLFVLCEVFMLIYQFIYYLSNPRDKNRVYYLVLLTLLILKNVSSGLFPDPEITGIPLVVQYGLAYGAGFLTASYFPFYFFKAFGLRQLKWHALYGVALLIILPFASCFIIVYLFTGNVDLAIDLGLVIPSIYGLYLLFAILNAIRKRYKEDVVRRQFGEVLAVYAAVTPWAFLAFFAYFRIEQVQEALLTNIGFIAITVLFIRKSIYESRQEYMWLEQLAKARLGNLPVSKLELIEETIAALRQTHVSGQHQKLEENMVTFSLTRREQEIVRLIRKGRSYKSIGEELFIAERTVTKHVQNIFEKLGVSNKIELINKLESEQTLQ